MDLNEQTFSSRLCSPTGIVSPSDPCNSLTNLGNDQIPTDNLSDRSGSSRSSQSKVRRPEGIFEAYHKIGSELKHSLRAFESNNLHLSDKLSRLQQEIQHLKRKRKIQKTTLVELQIKAEKLDQLNQTTVSECLLDKNKKLEELNKECQGICEDELYLTETQNKIKELLESDKKDMNEFSIRVQQEHANQIELYKNYKENIESTFTSSYEKVKSTIEEEKMVDLELEDALQQCKNNIGCKEKYEHELQEKFSNLALIENEVGGLNDRVRTCKEELSEILAENAELREAIVENQTTQCAELSKKKTLAEGLEIQLEEKTLDLTEKENKLKDAMEENKYLSELIANALSQIQVTTGEIEEVNVQIDNMNKRIAAGKSRLKEMEDRMIELGGIHKLEEQISSKKDVILKKLVTQNSIVSRLENKVVRLQDEWSKVENKRDELKIVEENRTKRNESAKKEINELSEGLDEFKERAKLKTLEQELREVNSRCHVLKEQNEAAENRLKSASEEIVNLEAENAVLDQELVELTAREAQASKNYGDFQNVRARLEELNTKILAVKDDVKRIRSAREFRVDVEQIKEEVAKVRLEVEQKMQQHEAQKASTQETFKKTLRNLQEQMEKLKEASEEEMRRRQSRTDRFEISIPQLQQEIQTCKNDLIRTTEENIAMMRERIKIISRLVESYRVLQEQSQTTKDKAFTVMRLLGTIEEHLASSFRGMRDYLDMTPVDLPSPSYLIYKRTLDNFERRFNKVTSEVSQRMTDPDPAILAELKLAAFCLFGLRRYSDVALSDSTFFSPASSSLVDF